MGDGPITDRTAANLGDAPAPQLSAVLGMYMQQAQSGLESYLEQFGAQWQAALQAQMGQPTEQMAAMTPAAARPARSPPVSERKAMQMVLSGQGFRCAQGSGFVVLKQMGATIAPRDYVSWDNQEIVFRPTPAEGMYVVTVATARGETVSSVPANPPE